MFKEHQSVAEPDSCSVDSYQGHILVVDDDTCQAEVLAHRFQSQGYRVSIATTGKCGLALARTEQPDLVVLDIRLPDIDGLKVCAELSDQPSTSLVPVIIVSGMERPDIVRASRAAGCLYFVRKPYDPNALLILARDAIRESSGW